MKHIERVAKILNKHAATQIEIIELLRSLPNAYQNLAFSSSLGLEDQVLTDMIFKNDLPVRVFFLDTGRHFAQTYETVERTEQFYGKKIEIYFPDNQDIQALYQAQGTVGFYQSVENRKQCCSVRKVLPLKSALQNTDIWITGLRAEQSAQRATIDFFEVDAHLSVLKFNPLVHWTLEDVWQYIKTHKVPYNPLHNQGFPSIGCQPCTRAVAQGEDLRSGRWWWEQSHKECGLHIKN